MLELNVLYKSSWLESNYWQNKTNSEGTLMPAIKELIDTSKDLFIELGIINSLESFSLEIQKSKYYAELLKEYIFEDVRINYYPQRPSRKNCMFLVPYSVDIITYSKNIELDLNNRTIIEIETMNSKKLHYANLSHLNCNSFKHTDKIEAAIQYWIGTDEVNINTEVLYTGSFKIKSIVASP